MATPNSWLFSGQSIFTIFYAASGKQINNSHWELAYHSIYVLDSSNVTRKGAKLGPEVEVGKMKIKT